MHPVSTVNGEGFTNLMQVAEPHYTVPCRKAITGLIDQKFLLLKNHMKSQMKLPAVYFLYPKCLHTGKI